MQGQHYSDTKTKQSLQEKKLQTNVFHEHRHKCPGFDFIAYQINNMQDAKYIVSKYCFSQACKVGFSCDRLNFPPKCQCLNPWNL